MLNEFKIENVIDSNRSINILERYTKSPIFRDGCRSISFDGIAIFDTEHVGRYANAAWAEDSPAHDQPGFVK